MVSHPTWVRGLKFLLTCLMEQWEQSHPTWVRGLKSTISALYPVMDEVAPHMGAWIEIWINRQLLRYRFRRTPHGCVD